MRTRERIKDLLCLVADRDIQETISTLLKRHQALGIRQLTSDILAHPEHDPGCRLQAQEFLRQYQRRYDHALVIFDREGCGVEDQPRETIEEGLEADLAKSGWGDRAAVVAIEPELESWIWSDSPHVDDVLGWANRSPKLCDWLESKGFMTSPGVKPGRPKEAMEEALWTVGKPRSSSIFRMLAEKIGVARCIDPAFDKLRKTLTGWFPVV